MLTQPTSSNVFFKTKCIIMKYRTGTLYNQKHAVSFKLSTSQTCPLCSQVDSALHIISGCQQTQIRNMITERHNISCRMILKAISKTGSLRSCVVPIEIGSNERMTIQNLQIPETAESRTVFNGSSHPASQLETELPPAAQNLCWLLPSLQEHKSNKLM